MKIKWELCLNFTRKTNKKHLAFLIAVLYSTKSWNIFLCVENIRLKELMISIKTVRQFWNFIKIFHLIKWTYCKEMISPFKRFTAYFFDCSFFAFPNLNKKVTIFRGQTLVWRIQKICSSEKNSVKSLIKTSVSVSALRSFVFNWFLGGNFDIDRVTNTSDLLGKPPMNEQNNVFEYNLSSLHISVFKDT